MKTSLMRCVTVLALLVSMGLASTVSADPVGGSISGVSRAPAYDTNVHRIVYFGGEQADFSIVGDGDTTLNLVVRDANGFVVARTTGPGDRCHVNWTPARTGVFYISVVNEGGVYNEYSWRAY
jgi:hypothetical protein